MTAEEYPGPTCYCGQKGCNETFISGTGFENEFKKQTGISKSGSRLLNATAAAVTIFVDPGPTEEVAIKICLRRIALA